MGQPVIVKYVSAVKGRLVIRWGTAQFFGARITTDKERKAGAGPIEWNEDRVYPLTQEFCARHPRELRQALKEGDLRERQAKDFDAWKKAEQERLKKEAADRKAAEAETKADEDSGDEPEGDAEQEESGSEPSESESESEPEQEESSPATKRARGRKGGK